MIGNSASGAGKASAIYKSVSLLGTALGLGLVILVTPLFYGWTYQPLYRYLAKTWPYEVAELLTWLFIILESIVIYTVIKIGFSMIAVFSMARAAAKRFPGPQ